MTEWSNHLIRHIIISTASVTALAGVAESQGSMNGIGTNSRFNNPVGVSISPDGRYALVADLNNHLIRRIDIITSYNTNTPPSPFSPAVTSLFNFGVKISEEGVFNSERAILVDYLQDRKTGQTSHHDYEMILSYFLVH